MQPPPLPAWASIRRTWKLTTCTAVPVMASSSKASLLHTFHQPLLLPRLQTSLATVQSHQYRALFQQVGVFVCFFLCFFFFFFFFCCFFTVSFFLFIDTWSYIDQMLNNLYTSQQISQQQYQVRSKNSTSNKLRKIKVVLNIHT